MIPYILTFYLFLILALIDELKIFLLNKKKIFFLKTLIFIFLITYIGLRDNVGGDWGNYYQNYFLYKLEANINFIDYLKNNIFIKDALFHLINYLIIKTYPSYHLVNFICAIIFVYFLINFCFKLKSPFLALLISCPYLITVVAMGYHRQALAVAFFMAGITQLEKNNFNNYFFLIFIAFCFHYTSFFLIVFGILANKKINIKHLFFLTFTGSTIIYFSNPILIFKVLDTYIFNPVMVSQGAYMRILLCFITSLIFLKFKNHPMLDIKNKRLLFSYSYITFIFIFVLMINPNLSTFVDRIIIYFIPFQLIIITNVLDVFSKKDHSRIIIFFIISLTYLSVLLIWIYFGAYSHWWFPYSNLLFK